MSTPPQIITYFISLIIISISAIGFLFSPSINLTTGSNKTNFQPSFEFVNFEPILTTESKFTQKLITENTIIPFITKYFDDDSLDFGTLKTQQSGQNGTTTEMIKLTYWQDEEFSRELERVTVKEPQPRIIARGTKITPGELETKFGKLNYFAKLLVFATSYDKNCRGCNLTTATGAELKYGIVAVDPKVIPLGTKIYIPGYGIGLAADTGGAVKGAKIDLAFDDVKSGWWSARWTDVYLLQ